VRLLDRHKTTEHTVLNLLARNILRRSQAVIGAGITPETRLYPQDQIGSVRLMIVMSVHVSKLAHRVCERILPAERL